MPATIHNRHLLGLKEFFPDEPLRAISDYVELLGQDLMQKTSAHFLSMFRNNAVPENEIMLQQFFTFNQLKHYDVPEYKMVISRYQVLEKIANGEKLALISVEPFLRMYMWLWQHPEIGKGQKEASPENMLAFFKLILIFNMKVAKDIRAAKNEASGYPDAVKYHRIQLAAAFPQSDFLNVDYMQLCITQFYKSIELLNFIEAEADFGNLFTAFLKEYQCGSKEDYFKSISLAVVLPMQRTDTGWSVISVSTTDNYEKSCDFLEKIAVDWDESAVSDEDDYLPLRSNPLQKLKRGEYRVIYDSFLIKKVYNGLVFYLSGMVRKDKTLFKGDFLGKLRQRFSENILLYRVMNNIYDNRNFKQITGDEFRAAGLEREPDFFLRQTNNVFLFESKDFYIKGSAKLSYNFGLVEPELKKNRFDKAVEQLAKNVGRVFNKQLILDDAYSVETCVVYPVVIVHDAIYSCPGLNFWINRWFQDQLKKLKREPGMEAVDLARIMPLTIMEIDTLILYEPKLKTGVMDLKTLLDSYHNQVHLNKFSFISKLQAEQHAMQSSIPFAEFARRYQYDHGIEPDLKRLFKMMKAYGIN